MFKHVAKRTEKRDTVRKPKDRRNGRFSGVACPCLNPSPSFLLLFCGKKVEETVTMSWFAPLARKQSLENSNIKPLSQGSPRQANIYCALLKYPFSPFRNKVINGIAQPTWQKPSQAKDEQVSL